LTLKEGHKAFYPGVLFRAKSRYLEHTLTRDNVIEDENYRKLLKIVERLVLRDLRGILRHRMTEAAKASPQKSIGADSAADGLPGKWERHWRFFDFLYRRSRSWIRSDGGISEWTVFPAVAGQPVSIEAVRAAARQKRGVYRDPDSNKVVTCKPVYYDSSPNRITDALQRMGLPVLQAGPWVDWIARQVGGRPLKVSSIFMWPEIVLDDAASLDTDTKSFFTTVRQLEGAVRRRYRKIVPGVFHYPGSSIQDVFFLTRKADDAGPAVRTGRHPVTFLDCVWSSLFDRARRYALINISHPFTRRLILLHRTQPGLAGYLCLKVIHLHDGRTPPDQRDKYSNLAENLETRLVQEAVRLDTDRVAARV